MREILFKAKRIDNGEWVEGCYVRDISRENTSLSKFAHRIQPLFPQAYAHPIDPNTICQYTGLTDKNGNKIWENDVVVYRDFTNENYVITWDLERSRFEYRQYGCTMMDFDELSGVEVEVIGNIFENPELIGGAENE